MAIIVIIYIAHAQWCLHSTSIEQEVFNLYRKSTPKNNEIMDNDNRPPACPTEHVYN